LKILSRFILSSSERAYRKEGFEKKLGKENVLDIRLFAYPNEYIAAVTLRKKTKEALNIAHELKGIFLDNNLAVGIYTKETH